MLEVIKHFFNVPNVHFVLGVNLTQLANSVRARYGHQADAEKYLQKFLTVTMPLKPPQNSRRPNNQQVEFFKEASYEIGLHPHFVSDLSEVLEAVEPHAELSFRDVQRLATLALVSPEPNLNMNSGYYIYIVLLVLKILRPDLIEKARLGELGDKELYGVINMPWDDLDSNPVPSYVRETWYAIVGNESMPHWRNYKRDHFPNHDPIAITKRVIATSLDAFELP